MFYIPQKYFYGVFPKRSISRLTFQVVFMLYIVLVSTDLSILVIKVDTFVIILYLPYIMAEICLCFLFLDVSYSNTLAFWKNSSGHCFDIEYIHYYQWYLEFWRVSNVSFLCWWLVLPFCEAIQDFPLSCSYHIHEIMMLFCTIFEIRSPLLVSALCSLTTNYWRDLQLWGLFI